MVLDAFSSDAIPVHLLTREAVELYLSKLAAGGVMALHISNRHLNLEPVLARVAESLGLTALMRRDRVSAAEERLGRTDTDWMVMARDPIDLQPLSGDARWVPARLDPRVQLWTDDYSNIVTLLVR